MDHKKKTPDSRFDAKERVKQDERFPSLLRSDEKVLPHLNALLEDEPTDREK